MKTHREKVKVWVYPGETAAWHFVSIDKKVSQKLREEYKKFSRGFGSLPVEAQVGKTKWRTSIFYDNRSEMYGLPIKAAVRQKENIREGETIDLKLKIFPKA